MKRASSSTLFESPSKRQMAQRTSIAPLGDFENETRSTIEAEFTTTIRGRRYCDTSLIGVGESLQWIRQHDNVADKNAIALYRSDRNGSSRVGYLPRDVALHLARHLDRSSIEMSISVVGIYAARFGKDVRIECRLKWDCEIDGCRDREILEALDRIKELSQLSFSGNVLCRNLKILLKTVEDEFHDLLKNEEKQFYRHLNELHLSALELLVRLYLRKGTWFRVNLLDCQTNDGFDSTLKELIDREMILHSSSLSIDLQIPILIDGLNMNEMKNILRQFKSHDIPCQLKGNRKRLVDEIHRILAKARCVFPFLCSMLDVQHPNWIDKLVKMTSGCISIEDRALSALKVAELLYFLDASQDLSTFLLQELDIQKWPHYRQRKTHRVFPDRSAFDAYSNALQLEVSLEKAIENKNSDAIEDCLGEVWSALDDGKHKDVSWTSNGSLEALPNKPVVVANAVPLFLARFTAPWVITKIATTGIGHLEKQKRFNDAVERLRALLGGNACPSSRGFWWNRLLIDLQHLKRPNEALETGESALADDWVRHGHRISIQRQILKLSKPPRKWKLPSWASQVSQLPPQVTFEAMSIESQIGIKLQFHGRSGNVSVEELALEYYSEDQNGSWKGIHTENSLWHTLFGILFWDIIFADVDDVFRSRFQSAPLDFGTDAFYLARRDLIERQLKTIQEGEFLDVFTRQWRAHHEEICRGVRWDRYSMEQHLEMMTCIGDEKLASICRLFAEDHKAVSGLFRLSICSNVEVGGLPDLFLWNKKRKECKLVEVKSPNDRCSDKQIAWIQVLKNIGFQIEIFKVRKPASHI